VILHEIVRTTNHICGGVDKTATMGWSPMQSPKIPWNSVMTQSNESPEGKCLTLQMTFRFNVTVDNTRFNIADNNIQAIN